MINPEAMPREKKYSCDYSSSEEADKKEAYVDGWNECREEFIRLLGNPPLLPNAERLPSTLVAYRVDYPALAGVGNRRYFGVDDMYALKMAVSYPGVSAVPLYAGDRLTEEQIVDMRAFNFSPL